MIESLVFYFFAAVTVFAALRVITARNPVHAALFLVLAFCSMAGVWLLLEAEFLAMTLILVYVGAVMVLFLFVVMMLEVNAVKMKEGFLLYLPVGGVVALVLFIELVAAASSGVFAVKPAVGQMAQHVNNTVEIGKVLYTKYLLGFEVAAIILLVALVGAVVLTIRSRKDAKYQNISAQVNVRKEDRIRKVRI